MDRETEQVCRNCVDCTIVGKLNPPEPLSMTKFPVKPWTFLSADILGPLPDGTSLIVLLDYYSRYFEVARVRTTSSEKVISFFDTVFSRFGLPEAVRTDSGPQFASSELQSYLNAAGIKWVSTTPLWPQANGAVERVNRTLLKVLRIAHTNRLNLDTELRKFLVSYRSTPHSSTGFAPFTLLFGRDMHTKLPSFIDQDVDDSIHDKAAENDTLAKFKNQQTANDTRHAIESDIKVGDKVFLNEEKGGKLSSNFQPAEQEVVARYGSEIIVKGDMGTKRRNVTFAKKVPPGYESSYNNLDGESELTSSHQYPQRQRRPPDHYGEAVPH
jgi:hypothetical protein